MHEHLANQRDQIRAIGLRHGARSIRVFGSRATATNRKDSDLDLLVDLLPGRSLLDLIAIKQDVEDLVGCPVDVVTEKGLKPALRERVLQKAMTL